MGSASSSPCGPAGTKWPEVGAQVILSAVTMRILSPGIDFYGNFISISGIFLSGTQSSVHVCLSNILTNHQETPPYRP